MDEVHFGAQRFWQRLQQDSCRQGTAQHNTACWHVGAADRLQPGFTAGPAGSCRASAVQLLNSLIHGKSLLATVQCGCLAGRRR